MYHLQIYWEFKYLGGMAEEIDHGIVKELFCNSDHRVLQFSILRTIIKGHQE